MKELPTPTLPLSPSTLPRRSLHPGSPDPDGAGLADLSAGGLLVAWARHEDEVRAAQRLRHAVFAEEMGARLRSPLPGHDIDIFDDFCEHLLVRDAATREVVGTYRVLTPAQARRIGSTYSDTEFDMTRLRNLRERMVETGRACVHLRYRQGGVVLALWSALGTFMRQNRLDTMVGCASIPLQLAGASGVAAAGGAAASIWNQVRERHLAPIEYHVRPRLPLPLERFDGSLDIAPPALIRGYLRLGAEVLGPPAWDPDFNSADLPMMLRMDRVHPRYRRNLLGE
ncbi:MAG: GNAT family N-acetyltransferase [Rhodoferax sp.]|nr:GNAT family N-acetyltransferase [Rhodoferax sp.]